MWKICRIQQDTGKLDFIFKEVKNISNYEKIFIICVVTKQAMIIITLIIIIFSSPSGQILEENRSIFTGISLWSVQSSIKSQTVGSLMIYTTATPGSTELPVRATLLPQFSYLKKRYWFLTAVFIKRRFCKWWLNDTT